MDLKKLTDIKYPESITFPLLHDHKAVIGPLTFEVIELIEEKFGTLEKMQDILTSKDVKKGDIFEVVFMLCENKDDFGDDVKEFVKHAPLMVLPNMMTALFHFMSVSFPDPDPDADEKGEGDEEGKK